MKISYCFSYDKENDDLLLYRPHSKSKGSIELGDIILDFDAKKEFVGIQILNASKLIREYTHEIVSSVKSILSQLESCKVETKQKNGFLLIKLLLVSKAKELAPIISVPSIQKQSPALAYT